MAIPLVATWWNAAVYPSIPFGLIIPEQKAVETSNVSEMFLDACITDSTIFVMTSAVNHMRQAKIQIRQGLYRITSKQLLSNSHIWLDAWFHSGMRFNTICTNCLVTFHKPAPESLSPWSWSAIYHRGHLCCRSSGFDCFRTRYIET